VTGWDQECHGVKWKAWWQMLRGDHSSLCRLLLPVVPDPMVVCLVMMKGEGQNFDRELDNRNVQGVHRVKLYVEAPAQLPDILREHKVRPYLLKVASILDHLAPDLIEM